METVNPIVRRWQREALEDPERFWDRAARELPWIRTWDRVFEWTYPHFRWFVGAQTNLAANCLDHHVANGRGGVAALIYANERGERRVFTYAQLLHLVERTAAALRGMGIRKGDRVTIYMPTCPEAVITMLATVRIGAIHSVVYAGFGAGALADRIKASGSRLVFAADVGYRKGREVPLKDIVDAAVDAGCETVEHVVVLRRSGGPFKGPRDVDWADFLARGTGHSGDAATMESNEPAYILATSGTTATPKLSVHMHGPYAVHVHSMARWVYDLSPRDVWWSTSDIGWIVGHSYIVYAPLLIGCTTIAYEGALDHPAPDVFWKIIDEFGVTSVFTAPTAVRLLMRYGEEPATGHRLTSLERLFCAGEPLNAPAWEWLQKTVLGDRIPVIDHMWQTETAGPIVGNPFGLGLLPIKPGSGGIALPGIDAAVVSPDGAPCGPGEKGILVIARPFPGLIQTLWGDPARYARDYWERIPGRRVYYTGDSAHLDEDGYVWFSGRADEIIKIAAHRIGTIEVETALLKHAAVAEAAVTGRPDEVRGEVISAFVVLKVGHEPSARLKDELIATVRRELGPVAVIGELNFVSIVPKTRSGKIMRRVLKAVILGRDPGDVSTIEDEGSIDEARDAWRAIQAEITAGR